MGRWGEGGLLRGLFRLALVAALLPAPLLADTAETVEEVEEAPEPCSCEEALEVEEEDPADELWVPSFELSLADTQFFAGSVVPDRLEQIVPTSAALFLAEIFITYRWRFITFFHLPLTPERVIDTATGELISQYSPPGLAAGLSFAPWFKDFKKKRRLELQLALVGGVFLRREPRFFPMTALRLYLLHAEDMGLYVGMAYAFAPGTVGLIYGFGYRF